MTDTQTPVKQQELRITRRFKHPREKVFQAWTEAAQIRQWLCPEGMTVIFTEADFRPKGIWRLGMQSSEGEDYIMRAVYQEIDPPARLRFTHAWEEDEELSPETLITVTFVENNHETEMTFEQVNFSSEESKSSHEEGWTDCFDKLAAYLSAK